MRLKRKRAIFTIVILLSGCAGASDSKIHVPTDPAVASSGATAPNADITTAENANGRRLAEMWRERSAQLADFPIGPGDLLEVSVPGIDQLQDRAARVGGDGHIYLPLAGDLPVAGETERAIREQLNQRMDKYLYHPQADIFVKSYASRQVAVMGAVERPGMYVLNGPEDTVRELLQRAGGIGDHGAREIVLTSAQAERQNAPDSPLRPEGRSSADDSLDAPMNQPAPDGRTDPEVRLISDPSPPARNAGSVVINLAPGSQNARYLDMPVRPGDTIYAPAAGSVTVVGWVYTPKTIAITPGLTVLGAVSAAGGALFAGDTKAVKLIRQKANGESESIEVNLDETKRQEVPDTPVQANDIVDVPYSAVRLPGYAVYYAALGIFQWAPAAVVTSGM